MWKREKQVKPRRSKTGYFQRPQKKIFSLLLRVSLVASSAYLYLHVLQFQLGLTRNHENEASSSASSHSSSSSHLGLFRSTPFCTFASFLASSNFCFNGSIFPRYQFQVWIWKPTTLCRKTICRISHLLPSLYFSFIWILSICLSSLNLLNLNAFLTRFFPFSWCFVAHCFVCPILLRYSGGEWRAPNGFTQENGNSALRFKYSTRCSHFLLLVLLDL